MNEPLRIFLRILGLVLFLGSLAGVALIVAVGPDQIGQQMGESCRRTNNGPSVNCTWQEALGILQALPYVTLVGGVLMLTMRRGWVGRDRHDSAEPVRTGRGPVQALGVLAVILVIVTNFAGVFVYRAAYTVVHEKETIEKIVKDTPRPDLAGRPTGS